MPPRSVVQQSGVVAAITIQLLFRLFGTRRRVVRAYDNYRVLYNNIIRIIVHTERRAGR